LTKRKIRIEEALEYHSSRGKGKITFIPIKPLKTQFELSLPYSPEVAEPCLEIKQQKKNANSFQAR
jgi:malate dehydrogenase (oxaloacetate-decarboxylating)(NADP+)